LYTSYSNNQTKALYTFGYLCKHSPLFEDFICRCELQYGTTLDSLLLKPTSRLSEYQPMFTHFINNVGKDNPLFLELLSVSTQFNAIASMITEKQMEMVHFTKYMKLQSCLIDQDILAATRVLAKRAEVLIEGEKHMIALFNDLVILLRVLPDIPWELKLVARSILDDSKAIALPDQAGGTNLFELKLVNESISTTYKIQAHSNTDRTQIIDYITSNVKAKRNSVNINSTEDLQQRKERLKKEIQESRRNHLRLSDLIYALERKLKQNTKEDETS